MRGGVGKPRPPAARLIEHGFYVNRARVERKYRIIDNKVSDDHRSQAKNPMVHALSGQWPFGQSKLDVKQHGRFAIGI